MKRILFALAAVPALLAASLQTSQAADGDHMRDHCRQYASKHLHVSADIINVKFEGQRVDKTYAVNGSAETDPPMTFQCNYGPDGRKITHFVFNSPKGCPADVSQADRYKYPDCD